jgi:hypothetical protein
LRQPLRLPVLALLAFAVATSHAGTARAQAGPEGAAAPAPPGVAPSTWARVPGQVERDPFATTTLGIDWSGFEPVASTWAIPISGGGFTQSDAAQLGQGDLSIGALHFFGHADLFVSVPLDTRSAEISGERSLSLEYQTATGIKLYPWALRPGTVRPYLSSGLLFRSLNLTEGADVSANPGEITQAVIPVGMGVAWRTPWQAIVDLQLQYMPGSFDLASGVVPQPLDQPVQPYTSESLDMRGIRLAVGLKWSRDLSGGDQPGYREEAARKLQRRIDAGSASGFTLALGPSARILGNSSSYFSQRRPYLEDRLDSGVFPHAGIGYYDFGRDAELRLAYRGFDSDAVAYGAALETRQDAVFLEALKFYDLDFYGFVPFIGVGIGYGWFRATDRIPTERLTGRESGLVASVPFGWDIRPDPASAWVLRTNLRWVPRARVPMPGAGVAVDLGGLEFDFIQLVVYPGRMFGQ